MVEGIFPTAPVGALTFCPSTRQQAGGSREMVAFLIEECGVPVDTLTGSWDMTALHAACGSACGSVCDEADTLSVVKYLVDQKGADVTLRNGTGATALEIALAQGRQQIYAFLAEREARQGAAALAEVQLAEKARAADIATQALLDEPATEDAKEEAQQKAKKSKKAKAKNKRARATIGEQGSTAASGGGGGASAAGGAAAAAADTMTATRPSLASLTAAVDRLTIAAGEEAEAREEMSHVPLPAAPSATLSLTSLPSANGAEEEDKGEEEDDEEAFQNFLFDNAPLEYHCPIGIRLLTDPVTATDGHIYQRVELEKWIETCRVKEQPLTSPMTKEPMLSMFSPAHFVKSQVGVFIEQQRQEWVAKQGKKKGGK